MAYGDFSFDGRYASESYLFTRQLDDVPKTDADSPEPVDQTFEPTFRIMTKDDGDILESIDASFELLQACAVEVIMEYHNLSKGTS